MLEDHDLENFKIQVSYGLGCEVIGGEGIRFTTT